MSQHLITDSMKPGRFQTWTRTAERLANISREPVTWVTHTGEVETRQPPKKIILGPSCWRTFVCTAASTGCSICCRYHEVTLDWLEGEKSLDQLREAKPAAVDDLSMIMSTVNGREVPIWTVSNFVSNDSGCRYLAPIDGTERCGLWPLNPLECRAAAVITIRRHSNSKTYITKQGYSRVHLWPERPQCRIDPVYPPEEAQTMIDLWSRYLEWSTIWGINTVIPEILQICHDIQDGKQELLESGWQLL